jgi:phosphatidylglycerophosphatase A
MNSGADPAIATKSKPRISILLATWFGLGRVPVAPGTWGSAAGSLLSVLINYLIFLKEAPALRIERDINFWTVGALPGIGEMLIAIVIAIIGVIVSTRAARYAQNKDPQWIVIDEVSGQLLTYCLFFWVLPLNWKSWLLGFILFRLFDIWKPFPARQLERLPGGWGIMADDWMAGVYAAILLRVALHFRMI